MNMTGDPNQQNRPSVFGIDYTYPPASPVDWNKFMPPPGAYPNPACEYTLFQPSNSYCFSPSTRPISPVQFPFATVNAPQMDGEFGNKPVHGSLRCKRKTNSPPPNVPQKQFITDEKMAEHMSQLHINSETSTASETKPVREQRLYLCEEMRKLQQESILPQSLLNRISRPCTALMLWTPPNRPDEDNGENNNNENVIDNNVMDLDSLN